MTGEAVDLPIQGESPQQIRDRIKRELKLASWTTQADFESTLIFYLNEIQQLPESYIQEFITLTNDVEDKRLRSLKSYWGFAHQFGVLINDVRKILANITIKLVTQKKMPAKDIDPEILFFQAAELGKQSASYGKIRRFFFYWMHRTEFDLIREHLRKAFASEDPYLHRAACEALNHVSLDFIRDFVSKNTVKGKFAEFPLLRRAIIERQTDIATSAISRKSLRLFKKVLAALAKKPQQDECEMLQLLLSRLVAEANDAWFPGAYDTMMEECLQRLMELSNPKQGLVIHPELLKKCLARVSHYRRAENRRKFFARTNPKNGYTMQMYCRVISPQLFGLANSIEFATNKTWAIFVFLLPEQRLQWFDDEKSLHEMVLHLQNHNSEQELYAFLKAILETVIVKCQNTPRIEDKMNIMLCWSSVTALIEQRRGHIKISLTKELLAAQLNEEDKFNLKLALWSDPVNREVFPIPIVNTPTNALVTVRECLTGVHDISVLRECIPAAGELLKELQPHEVRLLSELGLDTETEACMRQHVAYFKIFKSIIEKGGDFFEYAKHLLRAHEYESAAYLLYALNEKEREAFQDMVRNDLRQTFWNDAICQGNAALVWAWIMFGGVDVNQLTLWNRTPVIFDAVKNQHPEIVRLLLQAGADVTLKNELGISLRKYAETNGTPEIVEMIKAAEEERARFSVSLEAKREMDRRKSTGDAKEAAERNQLFTKTTRQRSRSTK